MYQINKKLSRFVEFKHEQYTRFLPCVRERVMFFLTIFLTSYTLCAQVFVGSETILVGKEYITVYKNADTIVVAQKEHAVVSALGDVKLFGFVEYTNADVRTVEKKKNPESAKKQEQIAKTNKIEKNKITVSKKLIPKKDNKFACTISSKETFTLGFSNTLIVAVGAGFSFNHRNAGVLENTKANFEFYAFFFNKINPYIQEVFDSLYLNSLRTRPPPMV